MTRFATFLGALAALWLIATPGVAQEYRVQPGDTLRVEVVEDQSLNRTLLVSPDGRISLPGAGALRVNGLTIEQIQRALAQRLAPGFVNPPNVFVDIQALAPEDEDPVTSIFVVGEANTVGRIELEPGTTLLQAFAQFGGFTNFAATKRIQLRRGSDIYTIDYNKILDGSSRNGSVRMHEGDVIIIPQRKLFE
ncbi:polysaccharide biosynthesis/export family protein [Cognatiyoonia sp. IB215446]|uniref:polysaccharide biosynthesis/export family protein n=1 Tax=Cognatiyoonia sp. IB215446 TaxID=3097355 RepID=UPI002A11E526|nr:polysaccharide biosynthesis/export family protein [Cognatiyoonia sp. IB215446]MDX8349216.1 polysaccharide biosynthesis/export family protein [Cognatiyoonia sp. IB215446]